MFWFDILWLRMQSTRAGGFQIARVDHQQTHSCEIREFHHEV